MIFFIRSQEKHDSQCPDRSLQHVWDSSYVLLHADHALVVIVVTRVTVTISDFHPRCERQAYETFGRYEFFLLAVSSDVDNWTHCT